jgi:nitrogenase molybdenum-iron protein NifN
LRPLLVPDLSGSLDGHLEDGWQPLTTGGTSRDELALLAGAQTAQAVGVTAAAGADRLAEAGTEVIRHPHLAGLAAVDAFVDALRRSSGLPVPARVRRDRARFTDTLLDAHFILDGARIAVAGEPELVAAVTTLVASAGARVVAAATPTDDPVLADLPCPEVVLGDLTDLRERAADGGAELVIGNGHTRAVADQLGAVHLPLGLPVPDRLGVALAAVTGYRGGQRFLTEVANRLLEHGEAGHRAVPGPRTGPVRRAGSTDHDTTEEMPC